MEPNASLDISYFEVLPAEECWDLLRTHQIGRVAWHSSAGISVLPVTFGVDEDQRIVFRTRPGSRLSELAAGGAVAFEVDWVADDAQVAWSVLARGEAGPVDQVPEVAAGLPVPWAPGERNLWLALTVSEISGRAMSAEAPK